MAEVCRNDENVPERDDEKIRLKKQITAKQSELETVHAELAELNGESAQSVHVTTVSGSVHNGSMIKDATNLKLSFSSMVAPAGAQSGPTPSNQVVAATEPELMGTAFASLTLNEFEIENCLKPSNYENGLGEDTMIDTLLFSNQHNINIPILQSKGQQELELNLPLFQEMTYFDGITHSKLIEQTTSYLPGRCTIAKIEADAHDGSKILEDKRISPRTASGKTAKYGSGQLRAMGQPPDFRVDIESRGWSAV